MKQFLTYLFIALFALSAVSCKKDKDEKVQLLKTITFHCGIPTYDSPYSNPPTSAYLNFEYDNQKRITSMFLSLVDDDGALFNSYTATLLYNGNDLIAQKGDIPFQIRTQQEGYSYKPILIRQNAIDEPLDFAKKENKITVHKQGQHIATIEMNSDGYPIKDSLLMDDNVWFTNYVWRYLDGNLVSRSYVNDNFDRQTFKYDNKKSPFYHCQTPKWFLLYYHKVLLSFEIKNNKIEWIERDSHNHELSIKYTYKYNSNGFPTEMYINGEPTATFTYY